MTPARTYRVRWDSGVVTHVEGIGKLLRILAAHPDTNMADSVGDPDKRMVDAVLLQRAKDASKPNAYTERRTLEQAVARAAMAFADAGGLGAPHLQVEALASNISRTVDEYRRAGGW